jgi:hypothetical protein
MARRSKPGGIPFIGVGVRISEARAREAFESAYPGLQRWHPLVVDECVLSVRGLPDRDNTSADNHFELEVAVCLAQLRRIWPGRYRDRRAFVVCGPDETWNNVAITAVRRLTGLDPHCVRPA